MLDVVGQVPLEQHLLASGLRTGHRDRVPALTAWSDSSEALLALLQEENRRGGFWTLSMRALISQVIHSHGSTPKALPPNPITLGVRIPHMGLEKMQTFSLEQKAILLDPSQVRRY